MRMANEGSTKPDYFALCDEHRALFEKNSLPYATCVRCLLASSEQKRYAAEAELLRVRGLLQRADEMRGHALVELSMMQSDRDDLRTALDEIVDKGEKHHYAPTLSKFTGDGMLCNVIDMAKKALEFSRRVPSGAESADIGKLDAADKSGKVNRVDDDEHVFAAIHPVRGATCHEIAEALDLKNNAVGKALGRLKAAGRIEHLASMRDGERMVRRAKLPNEAGLPDKDKMTTFAANCICAAGYATTCPIHGDPAKCKSVSGSAETGGEKAAPQPYCAECGKQRKYNGIICGDCGSMKTTDTPPTFPRSSQNQTVSSGVEGAHEGTTADKNTYDESTEFCEKLMSSSLAPTRTPQLRDSREPEKLNNAPRFAYRDDSTGTTFILRLGTHDVIIGWRGKDGYKDIADIKAAFDSMALAESSLSSPPPCVCSCEHTPECDPCKQGKHISKADIFRSLSSYSAASPELLPTQLPKEK
jgi:hypothetical protein